MPYRPLERVSLILTTFSFFIRFCRRLFAETFSCYRGEVRSHIFKQFVLCHSIWSVRPQTHTGALHLFIRCVYDVFWVHVIEYVWGPFRNYFIRSFPRRCFVRIERVVGVRCCKVVHAVALLYIKRGGVLTVVCDMRPVLHVDGCVEFYSLLPTEASALVRIRILNGSTTHTV